MANDYTQAPEIRSPSSGEQIEPVVAAFGQAMTQLSQDVVGWTLVEGQRVVTAKEGSAGK